jgi:plastocyanin
MRGPGVCLATLFAISLTAVPALAGPLTGTVVLPAGFRPAGDRHHTHWRVENGVLPIAPPLRDPRTEMVVYLEGGKAPIPAKAKTAVMEITGYRFKPYCVAIVAGGTVVFKNTGRATHVIYDEQKVMGPGSIKPGESRKQQYHAEGEYEIREEEFPHMRGVVKVLSTPLFVRPDARGSFKLDEVPEGKWTVKVWYRGAVLAQTVVEVTAKGGEAVLKVPEQKQASAPAKK